MIEKQDRMVQFTGKASKGYVIDRQAIMLNGGWSFVVAPQIGVLAL